MVPAPQAALLVAEILAESRQNRQIVTKMLARAVEVVIRRDVFWTFRCRVQHVDDGKTSRASLNESVGECES